MTEQTTAVAADGIQDQPELPDLGITCQQPPAGACPCRFPFQGFFVTTGQEAERQQWTYQDGIWRCPQHSAGKPWWPGEWDRTERLTDTENAERADYWANRVPRDDTPPLMPDLYDDGRPEDPGGAGEDWEASALAAGSDLPDPAGRDEIRDRNGVTFWADEMPDTDGEPTGFLTKIFPRIGGRR